MQGNYKLFSSVNYKFNALVISFIQTNLQSFVSNLIEKFKPFKKVKK